MEDQIQVNPKRKKFTFPTKIKVQHTHQENEKSTLKLSFEYITYLPTTFRSTKANAALALSTPLTTVVEKCLLSMKIKKNHFPPTLSTIAQTQSLPTNDIVTNNDNERGMNEENGIHFKTK